MRSWEGLPCPGTDCPHQTSRFQNLPQHTGYLRAKIRTWIIINFVQKRKIFYLSLSVSVLILGELHNGWRACLCVVIAFSQRKNWVTGCQQQTASWSCSRSSCHCGEKRSSLVSDEHSHTQSRCCPSTLILRTGWIVNTMADFFPSTHNKMLFVYTRMRLTPPSLVAAWRCGSDSLPPAWSRWRILVFCAESSGGHRSSSTLWSPVLGLQVRDVQQFQSKKTLTGSTNIISTKRFLLRTSDSAGSQQVDDIYVVSQVNEDLQLRHQRLLLCGMSACCEGHRKISSYS